MSTSPEFRPANDLEIALMNAQGGVISIDDFLTSLLASQVFMLVDKDLGPSGYWDNTATPLVINNQSGMPMLAIFTSPDRSAGWPQRFPQYSYGLLTQFRWLLKGIVKGVGLVMNPGCAVSLEMPAEGVVQLRAKAVK
jgi:hypothetical protein